MEFELASPTLSDMAQWVSRAVPARPTVPILAGVSLHCATDSLVIEASDLDWSFRSRSGCTVFEEGRCVVPGKLFADIVRALPSQVAHCRLTGAEFILECGGLEYHLARLDDSEYPTVRTIPDPVGSINGKDLATAADQVVPAAGRDERLAILTAIQVRVDADTMEFAATDRYRMATTRLDWAPLHAVPDGPTMLVPARLLAEVSRPGLNPETYDIGWGDGPASSPDQIGLRFRVGDEVREVRGRLMSGGLPPMNSFRNIETRLTIRVRTEDLRAAVRRVRLTTEPQTPIELAIDGSERISVSGASAGRVSGKAVISLSAIDSASTGPHQLAFNPQYLVDALNTFTTEYVEMRMSSEKLTAILHGSDGCNEAIQDDHCHVVKMMRPQ